MSAERLNDPAIRAFLERPRFATLSTVDADGAPFSAVVWYALEGDHILFNSADGRRWPANLRRDPRVAIMIEEGYDYVQILGRVHIIDDQEAAQAQMAKITARYSTTPEILAERIAQFRAEERIGFELTPSAIFTQGEPRVKRTVGAS
jgi:PPOX class probable F420-dependent enzyme